MEIVEPGRLCRVTARAFSLQAADSTKMRLESKPSEDGNAVVVDV